MKHDFEKIKRGDRSEFRLFFEQHFGSFCFFAYKILNDREAARDIVQDSFITFWKKKEELYSYESAKAYMFKFIKNRCLNYLRDNRSDFKVCVDFAIIPDYNSFLIEDEAYQIVHHLIKLLPPQSRRVMLFSLDGYKNAEIANELNISINTVKTLKSRSLKFLRQRLDGFTLNLFLTFFQ